MIVIFSHGEAQVTEPGPSDMADAPYLCQWPRYPECALYYPTLSEELARLREATRRRTVSSIDGRLVASTAVGLKERDHARN